MSSFLGATAAAALAVTGCLSPAGPRPVQAQPIPEVIENQPQAATNLRRRGGDVASSSGTSSEGIESRRGSLADEFDPSSPLDNRQNNGETLSSANTFHDYNLDMMGPPASGSSGGTSSSGSTGTGTTPPPAAVMTSFALRGKGGGIAAMATTTKDTADTGYAFDSSRPPPPIVLDDEVVAAARRIAQTTQRTDAANSTRTEVVAPSVEDADLDDSSHEEDVSLSSNHAGMDSPVGAPIDRRDAGAAISTMTATDIDTTVNEPEAIGDTGIGSGLDNSSSSQPIDDIPSPFTRPGNSANIRPAAAAASGMSGLGGLLSKYEEHVADGGGSAEVGEISASEKEEEEVRTEEEEEGPLRDYSSDPAFQSLSTSSESIDTTAEDSISEILAEASETLISDVLHVADPVEEEDLTQPEPLDDVDEVPLADFPADIDAADASIIQEARESATIAATAAVVRASLNEHQIPLMSSEETTKRQQDRERARRQVEINRQKTHEITVRTDCSHYNCQEVSSPKNDPDAWISVGPNGGRYKTIEHALEAGEKNIYVQEGTYEIRQTIILGQNHQGVHIRGASRERTILKFVGMESFVVVFNTRDVTISNLSLDARSANHDDLKDLDIYGAQPKTHLNGAKPQPQWQVVGVVNSSGVTIIDTVINAPKTMVPIFFTGPFFASSRIYSTFFGGSKSRYRPGDSETVQAYRAGSLDDDNAVRNNHIYSASGGDALVFTLQRNGVVDGNKVSSGGLSFYMNHASLCNQNTILRSPNYGIYVTVPSNQVEIANNKIIHSQKSGIKVGRISDHVELGLPSMETDERPQYRATGVALVGNQLFDIKSIGIEIELTHGCVVKHNSISRTDYSGIFLQHSDKPLIMNNRLEDFGLLADRHEHNAGIYGAAAVAEAVIRDNIIIDFMSHGARYGMKIAPLPENTGAIISQNTISGHYSSGESISAPNSSIEKDNTYIFD